ncbi:MAG: diaminopimelate epimerase [Deltaproteobacteria bacterium]|nr:diaminopimelate epimerase [Deltaproteobacteria bacterium]
MKLKTADNVLPFTKMSGTGNDFIVINNMQGTYAIDWSSFAAHYCTRRTSVGADGVLIIEGSTEADFNYRIFNADGSEAEMCGNGARCAALFAFQHKVAGRHMWFNTLAGIIEAKVNTHDISIRMTDPHNLEKDILLDIGTQQHRVDFINTGVPHTVIFTEDLSTISIIELGRAIRMHEHFSPAGTNVNFVQIMEDGHIRVRTYERGVEAETLACGTGAVASALISNCVRHVPGPPVHVHMPGGELSIDFLLDHESFSDVWLRGSVDIVYTGNISL